MVVCTEITVQTSLIHYTENVRQFHCFGSMHAHMIIGTLAIFGWIYIFFSISQ